MPESIEPGTLVDKLNTTLEKDGEVILLPNYPKSEGLYRLWVVSFGSKRYPHMISPFLDTDDYSYCSGNLTFLSTYPATSQFALANQHKTIIEYLASQFKEEEVDPRYVLFFGDVNDPLKKPDKEFIPLNLKSNVNMDVAIWEKGLSLCVFNKSLKDLFKGGRFHIGRLEREGVEYYRLSIQDDLLIASRMTNKEFF